MAYASGKDIVIGVGVFYSEDALREHLAQGGAPDLLFLEAGRQSREDDGIGSLIREGLRNEHMLLVYLLSDWKDVSWAAWNRPFFLFIPASNEPSSRACADIWRMPRG